MFMSSRFPLFFIIILSIVLCLASAQRLTHDAGSIGGLWSDVTVKPTGVAEPAVVCGNFNGTVSLIFTGGMTADERTSRDTFALNLTAAGTALAPVASLRARWETRPSPPIATANGVLAILQNPNDVYDQRVVYAFGWDLNNGFNSHMAVYDVAKSGWEISIASSQPAPRKAAGYWSHDDVLFVFGGGTLTAYDNNIYKLASFFTTFPTWSTAYFNAQNGGGYAQNHNFGTTPTPRMGQCCAYAYIGGNHKGVCFGGTTASGDSAEIWIYDEALETWTQGTHDPAKAPTPRRAASCGFLPDTNMFIVSGGYSSDEGSMPLNKTVFLFDVVGDAWQTPPAANASSVDYRDSKGCGLSGGVFVEVGGWDDASQIRYQVTMRTVANNYAPEYISDTRPSHVPSQRFGHNSVNIGPNIYVLFGKDNFEIFNTVFAYNTRTATWSQVTFTASATSSLPAGSEVPARWGGAAVQQGSSIYIFGGADDVGLVDDVLVLETSTSEFRIMSAQATASGSTTISAASSSSSTTASVVSAPTRYHHVMMIFSESLVVGTGLASTVAQTFASGWYRFSLERQEWTKIATLSGNAIDYRFGMSSARYSETKWIIGLGRSAESTFDFSFVSLSQDGTTLTFTRSAPTLTLDSDRRRVIRMFASIVVSSNHIFVFGGSSAPDTPPTAGAISYHFNIALKTVFPVRDLPVPVTGATAVANANKFYVFGGQRVTGAQVLDEYSDELQVFSVNSTDFCPAGATSDTNCILCGAGTQQPSCTPVAAGSYLTVGSTSTVATQCPAGTYNPLLGADSVSFCLKCAEKTYTDVSGSTSCKACPAGFVCSIGASEYLSPSVGYAKWLTEVEASDNGSTALFEHNPGPYSDYAPGIPLFPVLFVGLVTFVLAAALGIIIYLNRQVREQRREFFIPLGVQEDLAELYTEKATHISGMSESDWIGACFDERFPQHAVHATHLQRLFWQLDESNGTNAFRQHDYFAAIIKLIEDGDMPPIEGSTAQAEGVDGFTHWAPECIRNLDITVWDKYYDNHRSGEPGDELRNQKTWLGGVLSLGFYVVIIILFLVIVINFVFGNIVETKSAVPRAVIQSVFDGDTLARASTLQVRVAVVGPLHKKSSSQLREVCIQNNVSGVCNSHTSITITGIVDKDNTKRMHCNFIEATEECELEFSCHNCRIPTAATLLFEHSAFHSADVIRTRVLSTTGIRNPKVSWQGTLDLTGKPEDDSTSLSWVERRLTPSRDNHVFTGSPPSVFKFGVTSTFFSSATVAQNLDPAAPDHHGSGYHVRPNGAPTEGNSVKNTAFDHFHGVPVEVEITADSTPLYVKRAQVQTVIQLLVGVLSAMSGVGAGIVAVIQFTDGLFGINENSQRKRNQEVIESEGPEALYRDVERVPEEDEQDVLFLVKNDFRANVAWELVKIANEENNSKKAMKLRRQGKIL